MNKLKGRNFSDISNTSDNIDKEASVYLPQNICKRNPRIYINYSLCPYYRCLCKKISFTIFGFQMKLISLLTVLFKFTVQNIFLCFNFSQHICNQISFFYCLNTIKILNVLYSSYILFISALASTWRHRK